MNEYILNTFVPRYNLITPALHLLKGYYYFYLNSIYTTPISKYLKRPTFPLQSWTEVYKATEYRTNYRTYKTPKLKYIKRLISWSI